MQLLTLGYDPKMAHLTVLPLLKKLPALGAAKGHKAMWILCAAVGIQMCNLYEKNPKKVKRGKCCTHRLRSIGQRYGKVKFCAN